MVINLHIERLVLDGVDSTSGQNELLRASVTKELTQLFKSGGLASNLVDGAAVNRVNAKNIQVNGEKPQALGQQIAQSVYRGIGRE